MKMTTQYAMATILVILCALAPALAAPDKPSAKITGAEFARSLSGAALAAGATDVSRRIMETDHAKSGAPLTQAAAAALLRSGGFATTTADPGRALTREQADILVRQFGASVASPRVSSSANAGVPEGDALDACLQLDNHGQCVNCCKSLGGGASSCSKVCMAINKPSATEPLP